MKEKSITPGQKKLRILFFIIIITTVLSISTIVYQAFEVRVNMMTSIIEDRSKQTAIEIDRFVKPIIAILTTMQQWGAMEPFDIKNSKALTRKMIPLLDHDALSHISSLIIADIRGRAYMLMRQNEKWISRVSDADLPDAIINFHAWEKTDMVGKWIDKVDFDPRKRIWFEGAMGSNSTGMIYWSPPYRFQTIKKFGITAAIGVNLKKNHEATQVIALDTLLESLQLRLKSLSLPDSARLFIINKNHTISNLSTLINADLNRQADFDNILRNKTTDNVILEMLKAWEHTDNINHKAFKFKNNNSSWWGSIVSSDTRIANIGIAISSKNLLSASQKKDGLFIIFSLAILCAGAILVFLVAKAYARELQNNAALNSHINDTQEELTTLINIGEGDMLEFKSTLRWNLAIDKPGKEIEIACLKTIAAFLNSKGGTLLVGVNDDGDITGIQADNFASDDKFLLHFNNLINQHIGLEFARLITFNLKKMGDQKIFIVDCDKSDEPVFVRHKSTEDFYIRIGPGTKKLATSVVLEYLKNKK